MSDILKDSRFAKYLNDPRYRQIPKNERKVKIDKRFQSMFSDERFKVKYTVDKRGRPVNETSTENLRKYYDLEDSDESSDSDENEEKVVGKSQTEREPTPGRFVKRPASDEDISPLETPKFKNDKLVRGELVHKIKDRLLDLDVDYARGEGVLLTDSSSDDESSEEESESELEHEWGELDADAGTTEESTKRIAICNMDWDNIKATDIMVLLNSFLPPGGVIHKVTMVFFREASRSPAVVHVLSGPQTTVRDLLTSLKKTLSNRVETVGPMPTLSNIYPSEFGKKRMQEEEVRGPIELTEDNEQLSDNDGNEEGSTYHMEKLRRYQLNRLKYYYAVVECDSVAAADHLYRECDGIEYESSATKLDMRFIPDDISFDEEPREVCTRLPDLTKYKPRLFTTTALQQAKVELTWDATNPTRTDVIRGALSGKIDDLELKDYLASSSEDDNSAGEADDPQPENEDSDPIQKYKKLLEDIEKKEDSKKNKDMEMEITWGIGMKDKAEELVKKKINEENKDQTPFEKLMQKRKENKKQKKLKNQRKQEIQKDGTSESEDNSLDDVPSDIDMNDPYFAEEFNKPEFKKAKTDKKQIKQKIDNKDVDVEKRIAELELLLDEDDGKAHFSLKKIQDAEKTKKNNRKKKLKEKIMAQKQSIPDFEIDVNDQRFSALYDSHLFNIDPTDPNFKKTKNMEKLIEEKLKRRPAESPADVIPPKKSKEDVELSILVKNIKRKTKDVLRK